MKLKMTKACLFSGVVLASALFGCASQKAEVAEPAAPKKAPTSVHQMLPLVDRTVSNFKMTTDLGDDGIVVLEIFRPRDDLAELKIAGRVQRLLIEDARISQATGGILLEAPLERGRTFKGTFGQVKITETDQLVEVPAGTYSGCLTTIEESVNPPKRSTSTYCPGIGLVKMVVESFGEGAGLVTTELTYHGARVDLPKRQTAAPR